MRTLRYGVMTEEEMAEYWRPAPAIVEIVPMLTIEQKCRLVEIAATCSGEVRQAALDVLRDARFSVAQ